MFQVQRRGPKRIDIELSGKLDADAMKVALDALISETEGLEKGRMLYEVVDFHLPSLGAIALELSRLPSMLSLMKRFDRAAVLTDKAWIHQVSEFEGKLFPGLEIKAFDRDQRGEAGAWLAADS
ncbi:STAS/SEC14 domain-containing protein [Thiorhodococcus mannitoliphagus]|uniref:STAS/SEC14 domain-containing protein n=1 Tax=Thiorhodococcus mannitoliphagus TaxID=329406 RepID=A0A6P1E6C1_9GAMM|nr:STAS/SEC14 domain-containing protein [Thiorhodococcus mannitoliphagus]NEX23115.1 STAS/SEC14 domain-containing protein [Thiorhodococcus mannitoliphagus]